MAVRRGWVVGSATTPLPCWPRASRTARRGRDIDLWYWARKKDFGGNMQGLFYPGRPADVGLGHAAGEFP